jgi:hypothetical protein
MAADIRNCVLTALGKVVDQKTCSGIIGSAVRASQARNPRMRTGPRISPVRPCVLAQPAWLPCTSPQIRTPTPPDTRTSAGMSSRLCGPRLSGRHSHAPTPARTPTGTLIQKIQCQFRSCVTAPPTSGPQAIASPVTPPMMPTTAPRRSGGKAEVSSVRPSGIMMAAPMPWKARNVMRAVLFAARAQAADAAVNRARSAT